jgi:hypothetical protein
VAQGSIVPRNVDVAGDVDGDGDGDVAVGDLASVSEAGATQFPGRSGELLLQLVVAKLTRLCR